MLVSTCGHKCNVGLGIAQAHRDECSPACIPMSEDGQYCLSVFVRIRLIYT